MAYEELLEFWFGNLANGFADAPHRRRWFRVDASFDEEIRSRFGGLIEAALDGGLREWLADVHGRLAYVLLTDQFTRNVFRGTAKAFAGDSFALAAARDGVAMRADAQLGYDERAFFYVPFEHSESPVDQHTAVGLFTLLRDDSPRGQRRQTTTTLRFAVGHRDVVLRFGRFPHRNAVLGRTSTDEEIAFLATAARFGQA